MSKLNYGQSANEVRKLIIDIVDNNDFVLCLKPHTRGMTLNELNLPNLDNLVIEEKCGSRDLISWADIVIFTGSSIIFEAMIREKPVLYLSALQKYNSIFDDLPSHLKCSNSNSINEVLLRAMRDGYASWDLHDFIKQHVYGGTKGQICESFLSKFVGMTR